MTAMALIATIGAWGACSDRSRESAARPSTESAQAAPPAELRILLDPALSDERVTAMVAGAARAAGASFTPRGSFKCRRVTYLDTPGDHWLHRHGFTLRLRKKLDQRCQARERDRTRPALAISFNRRIEDRRAAETARSRLGPAASLDPRHVNHRFKHITAMSEHATVTYYWVGGTVRSLDREPRDLAGLSALFPGASALAGYRADRVLAPVGGLQIHERNIEIGAVSSDGTSLIVELARWSRAGPDGEAAAIASELLVPVKDEAWARQLASALNAALAAHHQPGETREALVYALATAGAPGPADARPEVQNLQ